MGIPKFARFLINRYPLILKKIKEESDVPELGKDKSYFNNFVDNLYLDINGVIHKCSHNNSVITMCKERKLEDIYYDIFRYIDEMVHLIKPKKLLMISADGVAPRAKMNQQRSRRFRKTDINKKELEALRKQGMDLQKMFNSDSISAGTEFMFDLSKAFDDFIREKMKTDPLWKNLKVVLTGVDVPGEGEHKIIEYIRNYKNSTEYEPNTKHCIYGLDADLIMLSLITHEPNICILREEVFGAKKSASDSTVRGQIKLREPFEFIFVSILREYLELEFLEIRPRLKFEFNIERIIDDFIFFCFFIGNDFLPNLNTLDIDHGALDNIFIYYKEVLPTLEDYITYHGKIDFKKAEKIFACLATHELNNIQQMLNKVEIECSNRDKKQRKAIEDRKKLLKIKKLMSRKENFLVKLKAKDEAFIVNFKKDRIKQKIGDFRKRYVEEMQSRDREIKFEEDIKNYLDEDLRNKINQVRDNRKPVTDNMPLPLGLELVQTDNASISEKEVESDVGTVTKKMENLKTDTLEDKKALVSLFDSDDETTNKLPNAVDVKKEVVTDNLRNIISQVSKYNRYIQDDNYCSEINIDDIEDEDVGVISDPEVDLEDVGKINEIDYANNQDMDKVFQQKLLQLYITDVNKAKAFYYKEKLGIDLDTPEGQEEHKNMFRKYFEGLQWVLYYYYRGIQSWRWYYPYHYPPMISDFNKIKDYLDYDIDKSFEYGKPFSPFQSLLFIMPKTSRDLFPKCYWGIYDEFPELYPNTFKIDFNGKKMPWESLVLLPFLPENTILDYEQKMSDLFHPSNTNKLPENDKNYVLSDKDLERNIHGQSYIYTQNESSNEVNKVPFEIYSEFTLTNLDSNYSLKTVDFHFPTMRTINYNYTFEMKKHYFGKDRKQEKKFRVISIKPVFTPHALNEQTVHFYVQNKVIYVNYPFKQEACIRGIIFNYNYYYLNHLNKVTIDTRWKVPEDTRELVRKEWQKKGVSFDYCSVLCDVSPLKCLARNSDGSITKIYEQYSFFVPFELTSLNAQVQDFKKLNSESQVFLQRFTKLDTEFSPDKPCLLLSKVGFGNMARIQNIVKKGENSKYDKFNDENYSKYYDTNFNYDLEGKDWEVNLNKLYCGPLVEVISKNSFQSSLINEPNIGNKIIKNSEEEYITMDELAKKLNISIWALGLLTSSIFVVNCTNEDEISEEAKISELEHWNVGLNMKCRFKNQKMVLPGYTRFVENTVNYGDAHCWEFSKSAVEIIMKYKEKFPFVFDCLEKYKNLYNRSNKFFRVYELFSTVDNFTDKLTEVAVWINSLDISKISFASHKSAFLSANDCKKIEDFITAKNKILRENQINSDFSQLMVLNPNYIYQETYPWVPPFMSYQPPPFQLGDRVVNIRSTDFTFIPFGEKGTVTAISNDYIEVMFDNEFPGGSTLNGRFRSRKGAYVKPLNLINLTK